MRGSHSSSNSGLNPFAKFDFEGTEEVQKAQKKVKRNIKCKPLMSPEGWKAFCINRWN